MESMTAHIDRWKLPLEEIAHELDTSQRPKEMVCLGCAAKISLVETVYPALKAIKAELGDHPKLKFEPREDAYFFGAKTKPLEFGRGVYSVKALLANEASVLSQVKADVEKYQPTGIVLLVSLTAEPSKDLFKQTMLAFLRAVAEGVPEGQRVSIGKGHSIQLSKTEDEAYVLVDYVKSDGDAINGVANNDTISTIDPNLMHTSWISVFVGLNNSLNDLFTEGVYENIEVYPTFDTRNPDEGDKIIKAFHAYAERFKDMGIRIIERPSIGFNTNSNGATVSGTTPKAGGPNECLQVGDYLIASRPIGDLAPLTEYLIRESLEEDTTDILELRKKVIQWMLLPNFEAAKIIAKYLPAKGETRDLNKHISATRDMTGPGILAVEELAQDSQVDIYIQNIKLFADWIADVQMPNPTSGTNGAIIIAAHPELAKQVWSDLEDVGYEPWLIGEVMEKNAEATIRINENLKQYHFVTGLNKGVFDNYRFEEDRKLIL